MGEQRRGRAILLVGPMGAGKSSVGLALASRRGWAHIDLDERVAEEAGMSIPEIFEREGEHGFRAREAAALEALPDDRCVVSLGGGALVAGGSRAVAARKGLLVWLDATPEALARRVGDGSGRPLLAGLDRAGIVARLAALRAARAQAYAQADVRIDTSDLGVDEVCARVEDALAEAGR